MGMLNDYSGGLKKQMERATKDHFCRSSLWHEHIHRYELAASLARGIVVDCACGVGYGSEVVAKRDAVESYLGIDPSVDAILYALDNYGDRRIHFEQGTLEHNSCAASSVDTFLMFETLEHTENPSAALANVCRCLKPDGLLIGSVPSAEYEALCESVYGPNPFHLQRFTKHRLARLLGEYFERVQIFSMEFVLGSLLRSIDKKAGIDTEILPSTANGCFTVLGSFVFVAGSANVIAQVRDKLGNRNKFFPSIPKAVLDREEVEPIRAAMRSMEGMIRDRDSVIAGQARMLEERWSIMQSMEGMIRDRDSVIAEQKYLLERRHSVKQAIRALLSAIDASLRHRLNRVLGKSQ